jgi:hypothetical protein
MLTWRAPWWMYLIATVYTLTLLFNARQEAWGPANAGWVPSWPRLEVARVMPGRAMDKGGLQAGDVLEAVDGRPITGMPDWFLARAHFERDRPIDVRIRRGGQHTALTVAISEPAWRTWSSAQFLGGAAFYSVRLILLVLAICVGFSRPEQTRACLAALMFAVGAVAEGNPSSGWAAALRHLPSVLAIPIGLATASCLLVSLVWLPFFATFRRAWFSRRVLRALVLAPLTIFGLPLIASVIAMIYAPGVLARPWPQVLSAAPVRALQDIADVSPLLFLNVLPGYEPVAQEALLQLWFAVNALYFVAGFVILTAGYRRAEDKGERRRIGALWVAVAIFGVVFVHNVVARNSTNWFAIPLPTMLSSAALLVVDVVFLIAPLTMAYFVLTEGRDIGKESTHGAEVT